MSKKEYHEWKKCGILPKGKAENGKVRLCPEKQRTERGYAEIILSDKGNCPYLTEHKLCQIQKEYGVKEMTATCRLFPRTVHSYFGHAECSLSLGCEKVLELLLTEREGLILKEEKPQSFEVYNSNYTIKDRKKYPTLKSYYDIQTLSLALLQSENITIENRLFLLGMAIEHIEALYANDASDKVSDYAMNFIQASQHPDYWNILERFPNNGLLLVFNNIISAIKSLDLPEDFKNSTLLKAEKAIAAKKEAGVKNPELEYYQECHESFLHWMDGKEYFFENVMVMCLLWLNIPFKDLEKSLWENYLYFIWIWIMLKGILCLSLTDEKTEENMIDSCVILFRKLGHTAKQFTNIIDGFHETGDSLAHVAILLRGC